MTPLRFNKAQDFIDALEAKRPEIRQRDAETLAKHKVEEKEELVRFRSECRRWAKMSYADLKTATTSRYEKGPRFEPPGCPMAEEVTLDRILDALAVTCQQRFEVYDGGNWRGAYRLLMGPAKPQDLC